MLGEKLIYDTLLKSNDRENFQSGVAPYNNNNTIAGIISCIVGIFSAYLAWNCNKNSGMVPRVLVTLFAFLFSLFYLIFYFFYHKIWNIECK